MEEQRKFCDAQVEEMMQLSIDLAREGIDMQLDATSMAAFHHACMNGGIMKILKDAWCNIWVETAKEAAAAGSCAASCDKIKSTKRKAVCVAACTTGSMFAAGCE